MAEDKEIRIRAVLDASTFDKGVSQIEEKLKKITQQQSQAAGAKQVLGKDTVLGKYAQQAFGDFSKESQRQLEQMYQVQRREAINQQVTLKGKQQELDKMAKSDMEMTKQQKERLELLKKEIDLLKEKHRQTLNTAAEIEKSMGKIGAGGAGGAGGGGAGGGIPGAPGGPEGGGIAGRAEQLFSGLLRGMTAAALIKGGFNAASQAYESFFVTRPREMEVAKGAAMTGISREMRENFAGQGSNRAFYARERARAFQMAQQERDRQEYLDVASGAAKIGGGALLGAGAGAMYGTEIAAATTAMTLGAAAPLAPFIIGGTTAAGAVVGGIGGYLGSSDRERKSVFDRERYKNQSLAEMMKNRETMEAAMIAQDPLRAHARDYFMNNYEQMAAFERKTGIRERYPMYGGGGLLRTQMRIGEKYGGGMLSMEDIMEQTGALYQAGGGTQAAQMSGMAGAINRQLGVTNAAQVMGRLQGMGNLGNQGTQEATRRLLAEAVRIGVDTSKMPQEMERMTALTAQISTAGGGYSAIAAQTLGAGVAGLSAGQIQAAGTAYERFESRAAESEGLTGQIGFGFLLGRGGEQAFGKEAIAKIRTNPRLMNQLQNMSAADLEKDTAVLRGMASDLGMSPDELLKAKKEMDINKQTLSEPEERLTRQLGELTQGMTATQIEGLATGTDEQAKQYQDLQYRLQQMRGGTLGKEYFRLGASGRTAENLMISRAGAGELPPLAPAEAAVEQALTAPITSAAEKEKSSRARGQADMLYNLNQNLEDFGKAADMSVKNADAINFAMDKFKTALEKNGGDVNTELQKIADQLEEFSKRMEQAGIPATKAK